MFSNFVRGSPMEYSCEITDVSPNLSSLEEEVI